MRHFLGGAPKYAAGGGGLPVSGAQLWLDASETSSITHSSGAVSQWDDKSGNGFHVSQGTAGNKPTTGANTLNGMNVLTFDGGDYLAYSGSTGLNVGAVTVFVVASETSEVNNAGLIAAYSAGLSDYDSASALVLETGSNAAVITAARAFDAGNGLATIAGSGATPPAIYAARFNSGGLIEVWSNGTAGTSGTRSVTFGTATGGWLVGARYLNGAPSTTYGLNGRIGEIIVYPSALSNADINTVGNYLERWNNTWTDI